VHQDSSLIDYKHFDLKELRVISVRLNRGSLPLRVQTVSDSARAKIVDLWKRLGYKAEITDAAGKTSQLYDVYIDFYPPGGHGSLFESVAAVTTFTVQTDNGGADEVEFDKIDHVDIQGDHFSVVLREQKTISGKFLLPTTQPAEVRVLGITDKYDPSSDQVYDFSVPLSKLKTITFSSGLIQ
jgi:hypothetical protein